VKRDSSKLTSMQSCWIFLREVLVPELESMKGRNVG